MAESVDINLTSNESISDSWSLGCDITIEEAGTDIQEIRLRDIDLIGDIYTGEVAVDINPELANVMELDINVTVDGVNPSIVESQIVTYENILKITDLSKETTNETRYASSARAAKKLYDLIRGIGNRVNVLESAEPSSGLDLEQLQEYLDMYKYIKEGYLEENKYVKEETLVEKIAEKLGEMFYWYDEAHTVIGTDYTFFSKGEISAKGLSLGSGSSGDGSGEETGGSTLLSGLTDVDIQNPTEGEIFSFNGTHWQNTILDLTEQLLPYLKSEEAADKYATITALNELKEKLDSITEEQFFYKTEDGKSIGTKYNLFSEGELSAGGLNLGGGSSSSGGLITSVLGTSAFGTVTSEDNSTTFNAYAIDSLHKRIVELEGKSEEDVDVDLSDYYTKQQTKDVMTVALIPYIKTADADKRYANLTAFNLLKSDFDGLYSALNDDTSGIINTWNEVVDFVNEYSGSEDLATILGKMNTEINARVKTTDFETWKTDEFTPLSTTVTNLKTQVDTNKSNIEMILDWFNVDADGNLFTTYNFYSTKELSANGLSLGAGASGGGLISSVLGATSLGATLANDNSVVFNAYAVNEVYKVTQNNVSRIGVLESQVGQLTTQSTKVSVSDLLTTGTKIATITVDGVSNAIYTPAIPTAIKSPYALTVNNSAGTELVAYDGSATKSLTLTKTVVGLGNVEDTALSTWSGTSKITTLGTITSGTWNGTKIANAYLANSAMTIAGMSVSLGGSITAATLKTNLGLGSLAYKSELVASDIPDLSGKYLPLTGGDLAGSLTLGSHDLYFKGSDTGGIVWYNNSNEEAARLYNSSGILSLRYNAGTTYSLIHSGNISSYVFKGTSSQFLKGDGSLDSTAYYHAGNLSALPNPKALKFGSKSYNGSTEQTITALDLGALTQHQTIYTLTFSAGAFSAGSFTANSAAKTINVPTHTSHLTNNSGYITGITSSMVTSALGYIPANSSSLSSYLPLSGGTVTGNLTVNGILYTDNIRSSNIYITTDQNLYLHAYGYVGNYAGRWKIDSYGNYRGNSLYIEAQASDNTNHPGIAVFVNGDIAATGEISASAINYGSDIRYKHKLGDVTLDIDTIADAPMFRFTWTNRESSRTQIGTSAQYWKNHARELVTVDNDDFHRLDYSTLGVLIGVTLGKTVKNHEDRIKELEREVVELKAENRRLRHEC